MRKRKYIISDIDTIVNKNDIVQFDQAIKKIIQYIKDYIDRNFMVDDFINWYDSDSDKPFICNSNSYHWR